MVWDCLPIVSVCATEAAGAQVLSPTWSAVMVTVPVFLMVTVFPVTEATEGSELVKVTTKPEVAVAEMVKGLSFALLPGKALNVIVCACVASWSEVITSF